MIFQIKQEKFEGPLEILLQLVQEEKLPISEISLAAVADEYLTYIKNLEAINPAELGEFLVVAAQLMLIKSRALLPQLALDEEQEAAVQELEDRLAAYKSMRELAQGIRQLEQKKRIVVTREAYLLMPLVFYPPSKTTGEKIAAAFAQVLAALPKIEKLAEEQIKRAVSLQETIRHVRTFLQYAVEKSFSEIVKNSRDKIDIIVNFLAILELSRQKFLDLDQKQLFDEIRIMRTRD